MSTLAHELAGFGLGLRWTELPAAARTAAVRALFNWVACAVGGSTTPSADAAVRGMEGLRRAGTTSIFGRRERLDLVDSAVVNCISSSAHTFDDTHLKTITHPTGPIAAAVMAFAQARPVSGEKLLAALAVGMEIECRLATAIAAPGSRSSKGWYMTGLAGGVGAAAAVARLMGLTQERFISALGLAATQASGLRSTHGSMAIAYVPGIAAQHGLAAAHLAEGGFECSAHAIDGTHGLLEVVAPGATAAQVTGELGSRYEFTTNTFKPYPCGIVIHPAIDACLELGGVYALHAEDVERLDLEVHPDALALCWRKLPTTTLDAQVSLFHWAAAALVFKAAGLQQGSLASVNDPRVRALQHRIHAAVSAEMASDEVVATARTSDGAVRRVHIAHAVGSLARPMTDEELEGKFQVLATDVLGARRTQELMRLCWQCEELEDAAMIAKTGVPE